MPSTPAAQGQSTPHSNLATNSPSSEPRSILEIDSANYLDTNYHVFLDRPDYTTFDEPYHASTQPIPGPSRDLHTSNQALSLDPSSSLISAVQSAWKERGGEIVFDRHAQVQEVSSNADTAELQALEFREASLPPDTTPPPPPRLYLASLPPSTLAPSAQNSPRYGESYLGPPTVPNSPTISQNGSPWPSSLRRTETNVSDSMSLLNNAPGKPRPVLDHAAAVSRLADVLDQPHRRVLSPYRRPGRHSRQSSVSGSGRYPLSSEASRPKRAGSLLSRSTTPAAWNVSPMPAPKANFAPPLATSSLTSQPDSHAQSTSPPQTEAGLSQAIPQLQPAPRLQPSPPQRPAPQWMPTPRPPSSLPTQLASSPSPPSPPSPRTAWHQGLPPQNPMPSSASLLPERQPTPPSPPSQRRTSTSSRPQQHVPPQPQQAEHLIQPFPYPPYPFDPSYTISGPTGYPDVHAHPSTFPGGQYMRSTQSAQYPPPLGMDYPWSVNMVWHDAASPTDSRRPTNGYGAGSGASSSIPWPLHTFQDLPQTGPSWLNHTPHTWSAMPPRSEEKSPRAFTPFAPSPEQPPNFSARPQHHPKMPEGNNQGSVPFPGFPQQPPPLSAQQPSQLPPSPQRQSGPSHADMGPRDAKGKQHDDFAPSLGVPRFQSTPPPYQHRNPPPRRPTPPEDTLGLLETNMRHLEFALGDIDGLTAYFGRADQVHDVKRHAMITGRVRAGLHTLTDVLARQRSLRPAQLQLGTQRWHKKCADRLGSLWRTIQSFGKFVHAISGREPTIRTLTKAFSKLIDFESKLSNLASKFNSLLNRLRARQLYSALSRAHLEANEQLRNARSKRDLPGWEEGKLYRAGLRREYVVFRTHVARGRRASLNS